jgi:hypothetical protein
MKKKKKTGVGRGEGIKACKSRVGLGMNYDMGGKLGSIEEKGPRQEKKQKKSWRAIWGNDLVVGQM